jgi:tetratricopeptide (TPR) repeat protein
LLEHPAEDLLLTYALDPSLVASAAELEGHLAGCGPCRERLAAIREDDELLGEEDSWPDSEEVVRRAAFNVLSAIATRNRREDAEADAMLSAKLGRFLAESSGALIWDDVASKPEYHTGGVVRKLADAADKAQYSVPLRALILGETASAIVGMLSTTTYTSAEIAALRGLTWKQQANANRQLGRFNAALEALDRAERAYRELARPELDLASITFIRGAISYEQQTYDIAEQHATASTSAFAQLGQTEWYFHSRHLQGCIAFEQRRFGEAQSIFESAYAYGESTSNLLWIAKESQALGNCYLERRELANAALYLHRGMLAFRELGMRLEEIRCRWGLALIVQREDRYRMAVPRLSAVRDEFIALGGVSDAALVTLDIMETFVLQGQPGEVRRTAGNIVQLFKEAGMVTGAVTAADYLKQAAATKSVTQSLIDYIRRYFRRVDFQPDLAFVPPAAL